MNYHDAIFKLMDLYGVRIFSNPFEARSILLDYVGNDLYSKSLIETIFKINSDLNLIDLFKNNGLAEARNSLNIYYKTSYKSKNKREFVDSVNPLSEYLLPEEFKKYEQNKIQTKPKPTVPKSQNIISTKSIIGPVPNSPTLKKVRKTKSNSIDFSALNSLNINVHAYIFKLQYKKDSQVKILVDNKEDKKSDSKIIINNNSINFHLNYPKSIVTLVLPKKDYETFNVAAKAFNVTIGEENKYKFNFKKATFDTNKINVISVEANTNECLFKGIDTFIFYNGKCEFMMCDYTKILHLIANYNNHNIPKMDLKYYTHYGNIKIHFKDDSASLRQRYNLFNKSTKKTIKVGQSDVIIDATINRGALLIS